MTYLFQNNLYEEEGFYIDTLTSFNGCDSIININLLFFDEATSSEDVTACDSFDWNMVTYTESGTYTIFQLLMLLVVILQLLYFNYQ